MRIRFDWRVHFWNSSVGFVTGFSGDPNIGFRTTSGGLSATDWNTITIDPGSGWSGPQFSALANGHVRISGISFCESLNFASTWSCEPSIDPGYDASHDGGKTWAVELDAGLGPQTCTAAHSRIFCAGVDNDATSHVYSREFDLNMHGEDD